MRPDGSAVPLTPEPDGWHAAQTTLQPCDRYKFDIDGAAYPDPASRAQPDGPDGWSEIADLDHYHWRAISWQGRPWSDTVLYELHIGTFSQDGTFLGAIAHLDHLVETGITMIELMPVATFPGSRNWGYDGTLLFAPDADYGTPEDLQRLVDECHLRGLSIVLDVVYNHFGPQSSHLGDIAPAFFTERHKTPWGPAIDFDAVPVRAFYVQNALQWVLDYRFDGLRLDAVQAIVDDGVRHILDEIAAEIRAAAPGRAVHLMLENDLNQARWLEPGAGYDAQWNDDFHHVMRVLVAGQTDGYYVDYATDPVEHLGRALTQGFSYQGQESIHRPGMLRGTSSGHLPPTRFVEFLQNHDQVGNAPYGKRLHRLAPPDAVHLGLAVLLLSPGIPMLFMGEEWAAGTPFDYFCDYDGELADAVRTGRRDEFRRFDEFQDEAALDKLADPVAIETFERSKLRWSELAERGHAQANARTRQLCLLRYKHLVPLLDAMPGGAASFTKLSERAIEARWPAGAKIWGIAANFSADAVAYRSPGFRVVHAIGPTPPDRLPGWGFRAFVRES